MWKKRIGWGVALFVVLYMMALTLPGFAFLGAFVFLLFLTVFVSYLEGSMKSVAIAVSIFIASSALFFGYYRLACGPNYFDVRVMKPMAEAIRDYIVKHGVPERLEEIPNLPYRLENCKKEITYGDENDIPRSYVTKNSKWEESIEVCYFKNITLSLRFVKNLKDEKKGLEGSLRMDSSHGTVSSVFIYQIRNGQFVFQDIHFSGKISGICNPMRQ